MGDIAVNNRDCQPIASLNTRLEKYKAEKERFLKRDFPRYLLMSLVMTSVGFYVFGKLILPALNFNQSSAFVSVSQVFSVSLLLVLPVITLNWPKKPTRRDVEADQELRRAFNMDDRTDEDVKQSSV